MTQLIYFCNITHSSYSLIELYFYNITRGSHSLIELYFYDTTPGSYSLIEQVSCNVFLMSNHMKHVGCVSSNRVRTITEMVRFQIYTTDYRDPHSLQQHQDDAHHLL